MKKLFPNFLMFFIGLFGFSQVFAVPLLQWNSYGLSGTETTLTTAFSHASMTSSTLSKGSGLSSSANSNRFGGDNWFHTGNSASSTLSEAISNGSYIEFSVTPAPGFSFSLSSFSFSWERSSTGPSSVALRSSVDGFSSDIGAVVGMPASISNNSIAISSINTKTSTIIFRLYGYGASNVAGTGGFDVASNVVNVTLDGSVCSLAEIDIKGGGKSIPYGSTQAFLVNNTHFGGVCTGSSATRNFVIQNQGNAALNLSSYTITPNAEFSITSTPASSVAAYSSTQIGITFSPTSLGKKTATLTLQSNDCDEGSYTFVLQGTGQCGTAVFVDSSATGNNDGSSWVNAFNDFQDALNVAVNQDTVFIAKGTYKPRIGSEPSPTTRTNTFRLSTGVKYYGGFPSGGGSFGSRDFVNNETILSGDLGTLNVKADNCFNVVDATGVGANTKLSGLTITNGNADSSNYLTIFYRGAAIATGSTNSIQLDSVNVRDNYGNSAVYFNTASSLLIRGCKFDNNENSAIRFDGSSNGGLQNCSFTNNNSAGTGGAILFNGTGTINLDSCLFSSNKALNYSGGAIETGYTAHTFTNCTFLNNESKDAGGAIYLSPFASVPSTFKNCYFEGNKAGGYSGGGAIYIGCGATIDGCWFKGNQTLAQTCCNTSGAAIYYFKGVSNITNSVFYDNRSPKGAAGGIYNNSSGSNLNVSQCTFVKNGSDLYGVGGIANNFTSTTTVSNSIFWGNYGYAGAVNANTQFSNGSVPSTVNNTIWQGNTSGGTIYNVDPLFTDINNAVLTLQDCSPAIDTGGNSGIVKDFLGNPRPIDNNLGGLSYDLGAYERQQVLLLPEINVQGNGNDIPNLLYGPTSLTNHTDFGNVSICSTTLTHTYTIQNKGTKPLNIYSITLNNGTPLEFSLGALSPASPIPANGSASFTVTFDPSNMGNRLTTVVINNDDCNEATYQFTIKGVGESREIDVLGNGQNIVDGKTSTSTTDSTTFSSVLIGNTHTRTFTIQNNGNAPLHISGVNFSGPDATSFSVVSLSQNNIPMFSSATLVVSFTPSSTGNKNATINILNDDCDEATFDFAISGTGICISPSFVSFPSNTTVPADALSCSSLQSYLITMTGHPSPSCSYILSGATSGSGNGPNLNVNFNKGTTSVSVTLTNGCGSNVVSTFDVTVEDRELPQIVAPADVVVNGICHPSTVAMAAPSVSDNCTGPITVSAKVGSSLINPGTYLFPVGTTTVTWTATDAANNTSQAKTQMVTINPATISVNASVSPLYPLSGQEIQTIYLGYPGSAQQVTITASPSGGNNNYSYTWTKGACNNPLSITSLSNTASTYTTPIASSADICSGNDDNIVEYTIQVTDGNACTASEVKRINTVDPFATSSNPNNILVCHQMRTRGRVIYQTLSLAPSQVAAHIQHGDQLANCTRFLGKMQSGIEELSQDVQVYPNPTTGFVIVELSQVNEQATISISDMQGREMSRKILENAGATTATFDLTKYPAGLYLIQVRDGSFYYNSKLILQ